MESIFLSQFLMFEMIAKKDWGREGRKFFAFLFVSFVSFVVFLVVIKWMGSPQDR